MLLKAHMLIEVCSPVHSDVNSNVVFEGTRTSSSLNSTSKLPRDTKLHSDLFYRLLLIGTHIDLSHSPSSPDPAPSPCGIVTSLFLTSEGCPLSLVSAEAEFLPKQLHST